MYCELFKDYYLQFAASLTTISNISFWSFGSLYLPSIFLLNALDSSTILIYSGDPALPWATNF